jgi:hypothetical protein
MNESPPKRKKERTENIHTTNFDCDKEPKIKGCQQSEPESPDGFYMKFMKNQRNRSPRMHVYRSSHAVKICSNRHFLLLWRIKVIITPLCCARLKSFYVVMLFDASTLAFLLRNFFGIHKFSRVINFQFTVLCIIYSFVSCLM